MRKAVRAFSGALLVLATVTACDKDPLSENRDQGSRFALNPSVAVINAGGETRVTAIVMNQHGGPIGAAVEAEPCDSKVTVIADSTRSAFEEPERFVVTGVTLGESCLVVRGGGVTDTITIRVVPASMRVTGADTLGSGSAAQLAVQFRNSAGAVVTGFSASNYTWTALDQTIAVVSSTGEVSARAPGTGRIVATTLSNTGAVRADTLRLVVRAGTFNGTATVGTAGATATAPIVGTSARVLTFTQGPIAFDADTQVRLLSGTTSLGVFTIIGTPTGTRQLVLPYGLANGTYNYEVTNIGPNQVAQIGTIAISGIPTADSQEPDETTATPKVMRPGEVFVGSLTDSDWRDLIKLEITTAGTYTVTGGWNDGSDIDMYVRNTANSASLLARETLANPETGAVALQPGTYWVRMDMYDFAPVGTRPSTYYIRVQ